MIIIPKALNRTAPTGGKPTLVRIVSPIAGNLSPVTNRPTLTVSPSKSQMVTTKRLIDYLRSLGLVVGDPKDMTLFEGSAQHTARVTNVPRKIYPEDKIALMHTGVGYKTDDYLSAVKEDKTRPSVTLTRQTPSKRASDPMSIHLDADKECLTLMY